MAAGVPGTSNPNNPVVFFDIAIGGQVCICKIWIQFFKLELFYLFGRPYFFLFNCPGYRGSEGFHVWRGLHENSILINKWVKKLTNCKTITSI